jgi:hypothetical protein
MEAYLGFAEVYDKFMDNVPYDEWTKYLVGLLKENGVKEGIVAELGCGTGNITDRLKAAGYDMIGIDNSAEMLQVAAEKDSDILYLCQDMREFELYGTVGAFVCICDGMNYILDKADLVKVFKLVNTFLDTNGVFIFDLNTIYKYENLLAENVITENRENMSFIWENYYDREDRINEYDLTIYLKDEEDNKERFFRFDEVHYQKGYNVDEIKEAVEEAGMEFVAVYDAFSKDAPKPDSERVYFIAREKYQEGKTYR